MARQPFYASLRGAPSRCRVPLLRDKNQLKRNTEKQPPINAD
jgi:hypothetical protein